MCIMYCNYIIDVHTTWGVYSLWGRNALEIFEALMWCALVNHTFFQNVKWHKEIIKILSDGK